MVMHISGLWLYQSETIILSMQIPQCHRFHVLLCWETGKLTAKTALLIKLATFSFEIKILLQNSVCNYLTLDSLTRVS